MPDKVLPCVTQIGKDRCIKEAVCIHTRKIYDSCKDKDCLEDFRVFLTRRGQEIIDCAINIKPKNAEVLYVYVDVEEIPFNQGFYTVDAKFFYRVTLDAFTCIGKPTEVTGLVTFDKRVILFGSEGKAKIFGSVYAENDLDPQLGIRSNLPKAVVECVDPIILDAKIIEVCHCGDKYNNCDICEVPTFIAGAFDDELVVSGDTKRVFVSLGQFSVFRLERDAQILIPAYDSTLPEKECTGIPGEGACDLFRRISFPVNEFCPPDFCEKEDKDHCGCRN